ncbi:Na+/H+ antiporter subunit E [Janibacter cremeus]|uniref:Multicomponent Na+:H+ antiporter subunit E n=1 Tax=Janibacter cremeus TaxID=1285192 RepID=A0A852VT39_9MICO|nr:Na+/H+ antiporter subunit E [Janibacter cremeus]NYF97823.1 multicomponent Na+:H+ antiporter subunit E [Janibacter cremeus]
MSPRRIGQHISSRTRGGFQPRAIIALALVWVLLWDRISLGNAINGLIIGAVITQIFPLPSIQYFGRIHPWRLLVLTARFFVDLVSAAIEVSIATVDHRPPRGGSIVEVHLRVRNELYMTIISALVSLVPGSIVVEARRTANVLYVHGFHVTTPEGLEELRQDVLDVETRVVRALGSAEELEAVMGTSRKESA